MDVAIGRELFREKVLSFNNLAALGLYIYLLCKPNSTETTTFEVMEHFGINLEELSILLREIRK